MEFWRAEQDMTPLAGQIYQAWHGMRGLLADMRVNTEYQGAVQLLSQFAQLNLKKYGIEQLGVIATGMRDGEFADRITKGPNASFTKEQISPNWLLWWGVQLGGTPVVEYSDRGKMRDGPAKVLPDLPTRELRDRFGNNLSALQVMSIVCMAAKKMPASRWARDMSIAINAATHKFALEQGMESRLKQLTAEIPSVSKQQLGDMFEHLKTNRDRAAGSKVDDNPLVESLEKQVRRLTRAQQVAGTAAKDISSLVKQSTTGLFADEEGGPSVTFNDLIRGANEAQLREAFALIGNKLGTQPAAASALPAPAAPAAVVTPETALVASVAGYKFSDKPEAKTAAAKKPAAKKTAAKKTAASRTKAPAAK